MASSKAFGTAQDKGRIKFGDLEFSLVLQQGLFAKAPKDLDDDPDLNEPEAPDVSTKPISPVIEYPTLGDAHSRPLVNLPGSSQQQPAKAAVVQDPDRSKGKQKETASDTASASVAPVSKWDPGQVITNEGDRRYYEAILKSIKRHVIAEGKQEVKETEKAYKSELASLGNIRKSRRHQVTIAILRHIVGNYPKLCNPVVEAGNAASKRLANVFKYLTSEECRKISKDGIVVDDINSAISDFCRDAYPYPQSGETHTKRLRRYKFVCFNNFAFLLASQKLLTDPELPQRALDGMMGWGELYEPRAYNHESIYVVSRWLTNPLGDRLLEEGSKARENLHELYMKIVQYTAKYMEMIENDSRKEFKLHKITVQAAQTKLEKLDPKLKVTDDSAKSFESALILAQTRVAKGDPGPENIYRNIVDMLEITKNAPAVDRPRLVMELTRMVEPLWKGASK